MRIKYPSLYSPENYSTQKVTIQPFNFESVIAQHLTSKILSLNFYPKADGMKSNLRQKCQSKNILWRLQGMVSP